MILANASLKKLIVLGLALLSGVAFSLSSFTARLFLPERLPDLIQFQTISVFLAFLVQSGLRAGLRNQFNLGRVRVVEEVENFLARKLPVYSAVLTLLLYFQDFYPIFPAYGVLHAKLTLLMMLRLVQGKQKSAAIFSIWIFLSIVIPCAMIMLVDLPLKALYVPIEALSLIGLLGISWGRDFRKIAPSTFRKVLRASMGMQMGSFTIYLLSFLLGHYVVVLSKDNIDVSVAFADVQVLVGVQSLLFSRVILFFERRLVELGRVNWLSMWIVAWSLLFSSVVFLGVAFIKGPVPAAFYAAFSLAIIGRESLSIIFQFIKETYRLESLALAIVFSLIFMGVIGVGTHGMWAALAVALLSPTVLSVILSLRALVSSDGYFLQAKVKS